jgi:RNA polymerase sigma factor (sigma-70 family)
VEHAEAGSLVVAAAAGDKAAWQMLVERFGSLVWSITRAYRLGHADAADVFQTTWLRLAEHLTRIEKPDRIGAWLATAARRECLQSIRASGRATPAEDMTRFERVSAADNPPEEAVLRAEHQQEQADRAAAVWQAFGRLSGRCRELLRVLMASPPPSYADVAAALDLPVGSIGPTRARCLQRLREQLPAGSSD